MGASIHIKGTISSIIDTVFVCRSTGSMPRKWLPESPIGIANLVDDDLEKLAAGNVKVTLGDIKCITYGHLIRLAIWSLRVAWDRDRQTESRIGEVASWINRFGGWAEVERCLNDAKTALKPRLVQMIRESSVEYGADDVEKSGFVEYPGFERAYEGL